MADNTGSTQNPFEQLASQQGKASPVASAPSQPLPEIPKPVASAYTTDQKPQSGTVQAGNLTLPFHGNPADIQSHIIPPQPQSSNPFEKMSAAQAQPGTSARQPQPQEREQVAAQENAALQYLHKAWGLVGKAVPQAATPYLAWDVQHIAEPLQKVDAAMGEFGGEVGTLPAQVAEHVKQLREKGLSYLIPQGLMTPRAGTAQLGSNVPVKELMTDEQFDDAVKTDFPNLYGVGKGVGELAAGLVSPTNLAILVAMPEAKAYPILSKILAYGFAAQMGPDALKQVDDVTKNWFTLSPAERAEKLTLAFGSTALATAATLHAATGKVEGKKGEAKAEVKATAKKSLVRPFMEKHAGVDVPRPASAQEGGSRVANVFEQLASPGAKKEFHETETKPAATQAFVSALSQSVEDQVNEHNAIVDNKVKPAPKAGTQIPGQYNDPDEMWVAQQNAANRTYNSARAISAKEVADWQARRDIAAKDVADWNADPENKDSQITEADLAIGDKPKTFDELRADLDEARARLNPNTNAPDVITKAKTTDIPKAEKAIDQWFKDHEDQISNAEYRSAQKLWADSENMKRIAQHVRGKLLAGTLTGNDIRKLSDVVDKPAVRRLGQRGLGTFNRLMGSETVANLQEIAKLFDPIDKDSPFVTVAKSIGHYTMKGVLGLMAGMSMGPIGEAVGALGGEVVGGWLEQKIFNRILFDPEWGQSFRALAEATRKSLETGLAVPQAIVGRMKNLVQTLKDKYAKSPLSREEGAVSLGGVKPRRTGDVRINPNADMRTAPNLEHDLRGFEDAKKESDEGRLPEGVSLLQRAQQLKEQYMADAGRALPNRPKYGFTDYAQGYAPHVEWVPIEDLKKFREYDRRVTPKWKSQDSGAHIDNLAEQIKQNGLEEPLMLEYSHQDGRALLSEGNHRLAALEQAGYTEAPVRVYRRDGPMYGKGAEVSGYRGEGHIPQDMKPSDIGINVSGGDATKPANLATGTGKTENHIASALDEFQRMSGRAPIDQTKVEVSQRAADIADAFDAMAHNPKDPQVKESYSALIDELKQQKAFLESKGYTFSLSDKDPYTSYEQMMDDIINNKHISVWTGGNQLAEGHPLAKEIGGGWTGNTLLRAVHDIMGHAAGDNDFSEKGEENAYNLHKQSFSERALPALTTETRGQTSWFFNNKAVREGAPLGKFAEQKAGILPEFRKGPPTPEGLVSKYGTSKDVFSHEASYVLPDGRIVGLPDGVTHDAAIGAKPSSNARVDYINDQHVLRSRYRMTRAGEEVAFSIPTDGVTQKQLNQMRYTAEGKIGRMVIEVASLDRDNPRFEVIDNPTGAKIAAAVKRLGAGVRSESLAADVSSQELADYFNANRGFTLNGEQGFMKDKPGYSVAGEYKHLDEVIPGQNITPAAIEEYRNRPDVQEALKDPRNSIGGWFYKGNAHLEISRLYDNREEAIAAGQRLNQNTIFDHSTKEEIPTGGTAGDEAAAAAAVGGIQPSTAGVAMAPEVPAPHVPEDRTASEINTTQPRSVKSDTSNNPTVNRSNMSAVDRATAASPTKQTGVGTTKLGYEEKMARTVGAYDFMGDTEGMTHRQIIDKFVKHISDNLEALWNMLPPALRERTMKWYVGANKIAVDMGKQYGYTPEQSAAVIAALSPQNEWDNNVALAQRTMDIYRNQQNHPYTEAMENQAKALAKMDTVSNTFKKMLRDIKGKKLKDIVVKEGDRISGRKVSAEEAKDVQDALRAVWIRVYDEAYGSSTVKSWSPEGEAVGDSDRQRSWIGADHGQKAVSIMDDGSIENINAQMGGKHKIRNFYNNIINPNSLNGHVTVDTHAVAAAHLSPFSGENTEVKHNFGSTNAGVPGAPGDAATGLSGTYPLHAEAYERVAKKLGIRPRELQSATWDAIRTVFEKKAKARLAPQVKDIWRQVGEGKMTADDARAQIMEMAGGIKKPNWMSDAEWDKVNGADFNPEEMNQANPFGFADEAPKPQPQPRPAPAPNFSTNEQGVTTLGKGEHQIAATLTFPELKLSPETIQKWKGAPEPMVTRTPSGKPSYAGGILQDIADYKNVNVTPEEAVNSAAHEMAHAFLQHHLGYDTREMKVNLSHRVMRKGKPMGEGLGKARLDGISGGYVHTGDVWNRELAAAGGQLNYREAKTKIIKDYVTQLMAGAAMEELLGNPSTEITTHAKGDMASAKNALQSALGVPSSYHAVLLAEAKGRAKAILKENWATVKHMSEQAVHHYGGDLIDSATFHKYRNGGVYGQP